LGHDPGFEVLVKPMALNIHPWAISRQPGAIVALSHLSILRNDDGIRRIDNGGTAMTFQ